MSLSSAFGLVFKPKKGSWGKLKCLLHSRCVLGNLLSPKGTLSIQVEIELFGENCPKVGPTFPSHYIYFCTIIARVTSSVMTLTCTSRRLLRRTRRSSVCPARRKVHRQTVFVIISSSLVFCQYSQQTHCTYMS